MCSCGGRVHRQGGDGIRGGDDNSEMGERDRERAAGVAGVCCCAAGTSNGSARVGGLLPASDREGIISKHPADLTLDPLHQLDKTSTCSSNSSASSGKRAGSDRRAASDASSSSGSRRPSSASSHSSSSTISTKSGRGRGNNSGSNNSGGGSSPWWGLFGGSGSGSGSGSGLGMFGYRTNAGAQSRTRPLSEYELVQSFTDSLTLVEGDNLDDEGLDVNDLGDDEENVIMFRSPGAMTHHRS